MQPLVQRVRVDPTGQAVVHVVAHAPLYQEVESIEVPIESVGFVPQIDWAVVMEGELQGGAVHCAGKVAIDDATHRGAFAIPYAMGVDGHGTRGLVIVSTAPISGQLPTEVALVVGREGRVSWPFAVGRDMDLGSILAVSVWPRGRVAAVPFAWDLSDGDLGAEVSIRLDPTLVKCHSFPTRSYWNLSALDGGVLYSMVICVVSPGSTAAEFR